MHHAFVIEEETEEGIAIAQAWVERELGMGAAKNPDVVVLRYGLFSVADARKVAELAAGVPFAGDSKAVIIAASRAYHEAQNALLKLFEEPPRGTFLFLIMPSLGSLLPTLRSRVQVLHGAADSRQKGMTHHTSGPARDFIEATREKRSAIIKRLTSGKDETTRRELRDEAIALLNGIEAATYHVGSPRPYMVELMEEIQVLRGYLYDRSAPVRMILEHLSLVLPKKLGD